MIYIPKQHSQAEVETYSSRANNLLTGQEEIGNPYHQPWLLPSLQLLLPGIQNSRTPVSLILTPPYKCPRHFKVWRCKVSYRRWSEPPVTDNFALGSSLTYTLLEMVTVQDLLLQVYLGEDEDEWPSMTVATPLGFITGTVVSPVLCSSHPQTDFRP